MAVAADDSQADQAGAEGRGVAARRRHHDAFICYARADRAIAERLQERLRERDVDAWRDVGEIVAGEPWRARIDAAIESCNAFVFVVTPASVASTECNRELAHAVVLSKLVMTVLAGAVDGALAPALLAGSPSGSTAAPTRKRPSPPSPRHSPATCRGETATAAVRAAAAAGTS